MRLNAPRGNQAFSHWAEAVTGSADCKGGRSAASGWWGWWLTVRPARGHHFADDVGAWPAGNGSTPRIRTPAETVDGTWSGYIYFTDLTLSHILVTADLAIYSKAQQILWTKPDILEGKVTMRLGGMHLAMAFIASIGKLYGDGGLQDILTSSETYAKNDVVKCQYSTFML